MKTPISDLIHKKALALGFDAIGFTTPNLPITVEQGLDEFLVAGHHGDMAWMENRKELRRNPSVLWPEAKSVIVLGHNYAPTENPLSQLEHLQHGVISVYAQNQDYHDIIKKKLKDLARALQSELGGEFKVFVDTAPVLEKPLAAQAGLGWQGKHTCLVSRDFGSWLFLGEIFTTLEIAPDEEEKNHCGSCTACLDICPTNAFTAPHKLDARKCISYLTIEHKGHIGREFRKAMGNRIYGCDDCLAVCPWNKFAQSSKEAAYHPRETLKSPLLSELLTLDNSGFRTLFSKSPVKRIGRDRFIRNVLIAAGNSGDKALLPQITVLFADESPLVRAMGVWASAQLSTDTEFAILREKNSASETDEQVMQEWSLYG